MILPTAAAIALITAAIAGHTALHHHKGTLLAEFDADLDRVEHAAQPGVVRLYHGNHRGGPKPGSPEEKTIHTTTQRIPEDVLRQILAGPKERR